MKDFASKTVLSNKLLKPSVWSWPWLLEDSGSGSQDSVRPGHGCGYLFETTLAQHFNLDDGLQRLTIGLLGLGLCAWVFITPHAAAQSGSLPPVGEASATTASSMESFSETGSAAPELQGYEYAQVEEQQSLLPFHQAPSPGGLGEGQSFDLVQYGFKVGIILLALLGGFYVFASVVMKRRLHSPDPEQLPVPQATTFPPLATLLQQLIPTSPAIKPEAQAAIAKLATSSSSEALSAMGIKVIGRQTVSPTHQVMVMECFDQLLVVGLTPQSMSLLARYELTDDEESQVLVEDDLVADQGQDAPELVQLPEEQSQPVAQPVYQKYLQAAIHTVIGPEASSKSHASPQSRVLNPASNSVANPIAKSLTESVAKSEPTPTAVKTVASKMAPASPPAQRTRRIALSQNPKHQPVLETPTKRPNPRLR